METMIQTRTDRNGVPRYETPWEESQQSRHLGRGIYSVSCAGHGGIFVPTSLLESIPIEGRNDAARWSGSENWYEEDCCWAWVAIAFPALFVTQHVDDAKATLIGRGFTIPK